MKSSSEQHTMSDGLFSRYEHLVKQPQEDRAKELLFKTASLVKPIMRKHGWKVGLLAEFMPSNPNLLGMNYNRGAKILIRLRPNHAPDTFLDLEQVVGTMLHELTHNVFGPHDAKFYELLGKLEEEYYELRRKGFSGEGFMSDGSRLGGSHGVPQHIGRIKGLEAAEKRVAKQKLMGPGAGGKLGGASAMRPTNKSPRELAAEAAERRLRDDKRCEHGDSQAIELEAAKAAKESEGQDASEIIVVEDDSSSEDDQVERSGKAVTSKAQAAVKADSKSSAPAVEAVVKSLRESPAIASQTSKNPKTRPQNSAMDPGTTRKWCSDDAPAAATAASSTWACQACTVINESASSQCSVCDTPRPGGTRTQSTNKIAAPAPKSPATLPLDNPDGTWNCQSCTFINRAELLGCQVCDTPRPRDESKGWYCDFCFQFGNEHAYWMCRSCGAIKRRG